MGQHSDYRRHLISHAGLYSWDFVKDKDFSTLATDLDSVHDRISDTIVNKHSFSYCHFPFIKN